MNKTTRVVVTLVAWTVAVPHLVAREPIDIGARRELFFDRHLIDKLDGAELRLQRPVDAGSVIKFDLPWEGRFSGYCTVLFDEGRYRLYYRGKPSVGEDGANDECTCYAESDDGIHWTKPLFDLHPTAAGEKTNRLLAGDGKFMHNFSPFIDGNPNTKPDQRYKAIGGTAKSGLIGYVSADGIHWQKIRQEPVFTAEGWVFDSQNVCFWSEVTGQYELYYRVVPDGVRAIAHASSDDFVNWSEPTVMTYSDTGNTQPSCHLYTNQTHPYFRAPHMRLATAARFMPGRRVVTDQQAAQVGALAKYAGDSSDAVLLTTRGNNRYDRTFLGALIRPGIGAENWVSRTNYPALNIVPTSDTEMSLYVNQNYGQLTAHLRRYAFRTDGLAALHAGHNGGAMLTKPLTFAGNELTLNIATSAAGEVLVEIQNAEGKPIEGFASSDCDPIIGNEIKRAVTWNGSADVSSLAGKTVQLRFELRDADVYSWRFQ